MFKRKQGWLWWCGFYLAFISCGIMLVAGLLKALPLLYAASALTAILLLANEILYQRGESFQEFKARALKDIPEGDPRRKEIENA